MNCLYRTHTATLYSMVLSVITTIHIHHDTCIYSFAHAILSLLKLSPRKDFPLPTTVFTNWLSLLFIYSYNQFKIVLWKCMCDSCRYYHSFMYKHPNSALAVAPPLYSSYCLYFLPYVETRHVPLFRITAYTFLRGQTVTCRHCLKVLHTWIFASTSGTGT